MNRADYNTVKAVNYSTLKHFRPPKGSPARYRYYLDNPVPATPAMLLGSAVHTAVLEPETLPLCYSVWDGRRAGNAWKEFKELEESDGKTILTISEFETCEAISDSVRSHPVAGKLLEHGEAEVTLEWTNKETGIKCKGRSDWVDGNLLLDLKTTNDISARNFSMHSWQMGTFFQMAMYQEGLLEMGRPVDRIGIIAVEQKPPHMCCVYWLDVTSLSAAWDEYISCLQMLKECRENDSYPGLTEDTLSAPSWILADQLTQEPLRFGGEEMEL